MVWLLCVWIRWTQCGSECSVFWSSRCVLRVWTRWTQDGVMCFVKSGAVSTGSGLCCVFASRAPFCQCVSAAGGAVVLAVVRLHLASAAQQRAVLPVWPMCVWLRWTQSGSVLSVRISRGRCSCAVFCQCGALSQAMGCAVCLCRTWSWSCEATSSVRAAR